MEECPNVYCPFCGVILLRDHELVSPPRKRPWFGEIRAVFTTGNKDTPPSLSGLGIIHRRSVLAAPLESELSYRDAPSLHDIKLFQSKTRKTNWGYGFHNSCWQLFLARLSRTDTLEDTLSCIFDLFYTTSCPSFSCFDFGHDYEGAAVTHKPTGRPLPIDMSSHLFADPCTVPSLDDLESHASKVLSTNCSAKNAVLEPTSNGLGHLLGRLPLELLYKVLSYLRLTQVAHLRLVNRHFALVARRETLPHSFWRSRFTVSGEQGFLCPDLSVRRDWYRLFLGTRFCLQAKNAPLINRRRIWTLLGSFDSLVERYRNQRLLGSEIYNETDNKWTQRLSTLSSGGLSESFQGVHSLCARLSYDSNQLTDGCRVQQFRLVEFPRRFSKDGGNIRVSTVHIGTRCYISGIEFQDAQVSRTKLSSMGFLTANAESIHIPPSAKIKTVEVAFRATGLVGIQLHFIEHEPSHWIGQNEGEGVVYGSLVVPENSATFHMVAGLDVCIGRGYHIHSILLTIVTKVYKIVALSLVQRATMTLSDDHDALFDSTSDLIQSHLWTPRIPIYAGLVLSSLEPQQTGSTFEPLINIDFGGLRGKLLSSLTRMVIYMVGDYSPIIGVRFFYTDKSVEFGNSGGVALSFLIDGPNGERISDIEMTVGDLQDGIGGIGSLKVCSRSQFWVI